METAQRTNRKRYKPSPSGKRIEITDNDIFGIFEPLARYGHLTTKQLKAYDKRHITKTGNRLTDLYHESAGQYLSRFSEHFRLTDHLSLDEMYRLGPEAEAFLITRRVIPPEKWVRTTKIGGHRQWMPSRVIQLVHDHACCDVVVDIELAAPDFKNHIEIIKEAPPKTIDLSNPLRIPIPKITGVAKTVEPDGLFAINGRYYALEFDTGSESIKGIIIPKILAYREIVASGVIDDHFGIDNLTALFVTTNPTRQKHIMDAVAEIAKNRKSAMFGFACRPDLADIARVPAPDGKMYRLQYERVGFPPLQLGQK
jgi:hypothetical protein